MYDTLWDAFLSIDDADSRIRRGLAKRYELQAGTLHRRQYKFFYNRKFAVIISSIIYPNFIFIFRFKHKACGFIIVA